MNSYGMDNNQTVYWGGGTVYDYTKDPYLQNLKLSTAKLTTTKEDDGKVRKGVYDVITFDKYGKILRNENNIVAVSEEEAKFKAGVYHYLELYDYDLADVIVKCYKKFDITVIEEKEDENSMVAGTN